MLWLILGLTAVLGQHCEDRENSLSDNLNPSCNLAGTCVDNFCYCCELDAKTLEPTLFEGEPDCPGWTGGKYENTVQGPCASQQEFATVRWKYYFPPSANYNCNDNSGLETLRDTIKQFYTDREYDGSCVLADEDRDSTEPACRRCRPNNPCRFVSDPEDTSQFVDHVTGVQVEVGTDLHTYYDMSCFDPNDPIPSLYFQERCPANYDQGYKAYTAFKRVKFYNPTEPDAWNGPGTADINYINQQLSVGATESSFTVIVNNKDVSVRTRGPTSAPSPVPTTADPTEHPSPSPTYAPTLHPTEFPTLPPTLHPSEFPTLPPTLNPTEFPTLPPTLDPTLHPSEFPTPAPTAVPSIGDTCFSLGYTNTPEDIKYMGNGVSCRGGIEDSWPGGKSCDSPYIVCLPQENTPNQDPKNPFFDDTHKYTVDECIFECAWDQRCRGFEFDAERGTNVGTCVLIDDLPLVIEVPGSYVYDPADPNFNGKGSLCFQKESYCNPFFEADDLEQTMLDCYCPNNRKGFYTKKVKRLVENHKYCEDPTGPETERIKQAAANRMFHLCENWCLFNTFKPEQESWYWNPWKKCWREQYAGTGAHRSYCNRVIRNPDTIEQYFINYRTENFCAPFSQLPTKQPSSLGIRWYLAQEEQTCTDACDDRGEVCSEEITASLGETSLDAEVGSSFTEGGATCVSYAVAPEDWAAPYIDRAGVCYKRNDNTEANTGCDWAVGVGYQRLCACTD